MQNEEEKKRAMCCCVKKQTNIKYPSDFTKVYSSIHCNSSLWGICLGTKNVLTWDFTVRGPRTAPCPWAPGTLATPLISEHSALFTGDTANFFAAFSTL